MPLQPQHEDFLLCAKRPQEWNDFCTGSPHVYKTAAGMRRLKENGVSSALAPLAHEILEFWHFGILKSWNPEIMKSWNLRILESWSPGTLESWNSWILTFWNPEIFCLGSRVGIIYLLPYSMIWGLSGDGLRDTVVPGRCFVKSFNSEEESFRVNVCKVWI